LYKICRIIETLSGIFAREYQNTRSNSSGEIWQNKPTAILNRLKSDHLNENFQIHEFEFELRSNIISIHN
jgi:hypothetical protein